MALDLDPACQKSASLTNLYPKRARPILLRRLILLVTSAPLGIHHTISQ